MTITSAQTDTKPPRRGIRRTTNHPDNRAVAANLKAAAQLKGKPLTAEQLADLLEVTPATAARMLDGQATWYVSDILTVCRQLEISVGRAIL